MKPQVSVIIPSFNYGHFLPETLQSVKHQSCNDWECIIVDDGSTDNTKNVAARFVSEDPRFKYVYQENRGLSSARNTGISHATGDFIQLLDADDLIEEKKLERQLEVFAGHPEADIVYGEARFFHDGSPNERLYSVWGNNQPWMPKVSGSGHGILKALLVTNIMVVSSPLVRKQVFQTCGLFDESLKNHEDWEFWLRCAQKGRYFLFLDRAETFTLIRFHPESMSQSRAAMFEVNLRIRRKLFQDLNNKELVKINKRHYRLIGFELALDNIKTGNKFSGFLSLARYCLNSEHLDKFLYGCKLMVFGHRG
jgi:glycosyltransferase involved in cell wall biosynthesis